MTFPYYANNCCMNMMPGIMPNMYGMGNCYPTMYGRLGYGYNPFSNVFSRIGRMFGMGNRYAANMGYPYGNLLTMNNRMNMGSMLGYGYINTSGIPAYSEATAGLGSIPNFNFATSALADNTTFLNRIMAILSDTTPLTNLYNAYGSGNVNFNA